MHPPSFECSVYSIIMDQASGTGATLELGEGATEHEASTVIIIGVRNQFYKNGGKTNDLAFLEHWWAGTISTTTFPGAKICRLLASLLVLLACSVIN